MNWHNYLVYFHPSLVTLVGKKQKGRKEKRRKEEEEKRKEGRKEEGRKEERREEGERKEERRRERGRTNIFQGTTVWWNCYFKEPNHC